MKVMEHACMHMHSYMSTALFIQLTLFKKDCNKDLSVFVADFSVMYLYSVLVKT